jgi:hypothetical protein
MELQGTGMPQTGSIFALNLQRAKREGFPCMASFPKIRVPRKKSADFGDYLCSPIGYGNKSVLRTACNCLERKGFIAGKMRAISSRLHQSQSPLRSEAGRALRPNSPSAPSRLRMRPFARSTLPAPGAAGISDAHFAAARTASSHPPAAVHHPLKGA